MHRLDLERDQRYRLVPTSACLGVAVREGREAGAGSGCICAWKGVAWTHLKLPSL